MAPSDKSAMRYMMAIGLGNELKLEGIAYVAIRFHGQSFLLHQIRKMVAMAVATFRGDVRPARAIAGGPRPRVVPGLLGEVPMGVAGNAADLRVMELL